MRVSRLSLILMTACSLLVSCDRIDLAQQKHIRAHNALVQILVETQIAVIEHPLTNTIQFTQWVESYLSSTNKTAKELRSVCDVVWVNAVFNDWLSSVSTNHNPTSATAMVAQYQVDAKDCVIGITFNGKSVEQSGPPKFGFEKHDLKEAPGVTPLRR